MLDWTTLSADEIVIFCSEYQSTNGMRESERIASAEKAVMLQRSLAAGDLGKGRAAAIAKRAGFGSLDGFIQHVREEACRRFSVHRREFARKEGRLARWWAATVLVEIFGMELAAERFKSADRVKQCMQDLETVEPDRFGEAKVFAREVLARANSGR